MKAIEIDFDQATRLMKMDVLYKGKDYWFNRLYSLNELIMKLEHQIKFS